MAADAAAPTDELRQRAELYLLHELKVTPGWPRHYARLPPDELGRRGYERDERAHVLQKFRGEVETLRLLGILDEGEAAAWLARFASAVEGTEPCLVQPEPEPDPDAEERARRLLEERLSQVSESAAGEDERSAMSEFEEALRVVRVAGALTHEEIERWSARMAAAASVEEQERLASRRHWPPPWSGAQLEHVAVGSAERQDGLAITHVELHPDALVIHWQRVAAIELPEGRDATLAARHRAIRAAYPPFGWPELEVRDDIGTRYVSVPGRAFSEYAQSEDVVVAWGAERLYPAVPHDASELHVACDDAVFELALTR